MFKRFLLLILIVALTLASSFLMMRVVGHMFAGLSQTSTESVGATIVKMLFLQFLPAIVAVVVPLLLFWLGPYWQTELVNWFACFAGLYMGSTLTLVPTILHEGRAELLAGVSVVGVFFIFLVADLVAMRMRDGRWRGCIVGAYPEG